MTASPGGSYLIHGGSIFTMEAAHPWVQALAIRDGVIVHAGTFDSAALHVDSSMEVIDLRGAFCMPGFIDAHDHFATFAITKLGVNVAGLTTRDAVLAAIRDHVAADESEGLLRGYGWIQDTFSPGGPRREWLDDITGDRPMVLFSADSHDLWFNSAAMTMAGITASTPDPAPGAQYFWRDPDGTPTGWAIEGAQILVSVPLGVYDMEGVRASQELTITPAPSWGITTYMEAGAIVGSSSSDSAAVYADLVERDDVGMLPLRIVGTVWTRNESDDPSAIAAELAQWNARFRSPHVQVSICKMWSDGVMMSGGALLLEPFCNDPANHGHMTLPLEQIIRTTIAVQEAGFDMHIHVDADGSTRTVLDALEAAHAQIGRGDSRHAIAHNSMVSPSDMPRYAHLGILANCTPLWGTDYNGQYFDIYASLLGEARMEERLFPYGDLIRSGAVVTYGADIPGVDLHEIPPLLQIEAAVTRRRPGFPEDRPLVERQRIDLADALRAYTINGAYQLRLEHQVGSLATGKRADLVVLEADPFRVPADQIHAIPVQLTMMDGRITYRA